MRVIRRIGYWVEDPELWRRILASGSVPTARHQHYVWPDPVAIVAACGAQTPDPRVVRYLRTGIPGDMQMGYSWCRFRCGIPDNELGCSEMTDGVWIWPDGLAHYVEVHGVPLPEEVIETMRAHSWVPPVEPPASADRRYEIDNSFWEEWGRSRSVPK